MNLFARIYYDDPDRPLPVTYAVMMLYIWLALLAVFSVLSTILYVTTQQQAMSPTTAVFSLITSLVAYGIMYVVARKIGEGENWARWLLVAGFVLSVASALCEMPTLIAGATMMNLMRFGELIVSGLAVALLFQRPSNAWFVSKRKDTRGDPAPDGS